MKFGLRKRDWHFAPTGVQRTETDDSAVQHGSCVASKAAGAGFGVSRESRLIILKASRRVSNLSWALYKARDDIAANNRQGKSVVLFAKSNSEPGIPAGEEWPRMRSYMKELFDMDVVVVNSAGNKGTQQGRRQIDTVPQIYESSDFPLIVAGAVDNEGLRVPLSQGPAHVTAWAPGFNVGCVRGRFTSGTGTSASAGAVSRSQWRKRKYFAALADLDLQVAGLVAYFLGLDPPPFAVGGGNTAKNVKRFLQTTASWQRNPGGPENVVWNLEDGTIAAPHLNTSDFQNLSSIATS